MKHALRALIKIRSSCRILGHMSRVANMILQSSETKQIFLDKINNLRQKIRSNSIGNTLQELERFENQLTLDELETCFKNSDTEALDANLIAVLSHRWQRIRGRAMSYTQKPANVVNQLCLELAIAIAPPINTELEIEALAPNTGPYCLLMPSIEKTLDVYGNNIHSLGLHEFILSENERVFIPIAQCLQQASQSDEGQLRHLMSIDDKYPELNKKEIKSLCEHSTQADKLCKAVMTLNQQRLWGDDLGAKLGQLASALRAGSVSGNGKEFDASFVANEGIAAFSAFWEGLTVRKRTSIFASTPILETLLGRLFRPDEANYQDTIYCVSLLADNFDSIITFYNNNPKVNVLEAKVKDLALEFNFIAKNKPDMFISKNMLPPNHILHLIFKWPLAQQKALFKIEGCAHALQYALTYAPEALPDFELTQEWKRYAISARIGFDNKSAVIVAAQSGKVDAIRFLVGIGADINYPTLNGYTALHYAASGGCVDTVKCLLDNGASLEGTDSNNNTALHMAVSNGKKEVVALLLENNANLNAKNRQGKNVLDCALCVYPVQNTDIIKLILMHIATLPINEQIACTGTYPNVLFYAAERMPQLFAALIDTVLTNCDIELRDTMLRAVSIQGKTPIKLAAQLGALESVTKLLEYGIDIESAGPNKGVTTLHWAASFGQLKIVRYLLENGASLNALSKENFSALHYAVKNCKGAVVSFLLGKNADILIRNDNGNNVLDMALQRDLSLVRLILPNLATKSLPEQAEALSKVDGGLHRDVYSYLALNDHYLFEQLLSTNADNKFKDLNKALPNQRFEWPLRNICKHYVLMKEKSQSNAKYVAATDAAKTLLLKCIDAKIALYQSDAPVNMKLQAFKNTCNQAIESSKPVLSQHRECWQMIAMLLLVIITLPLSVPAYALGLFSFKTASEELLDEFEADLDAFISSGP